MQDRMMVQSMPSLLAVYPGFVDDSMGQQLTSSLFKEGLLIGSLPVCLLCFQLQLACHFGLAGLQAVHLLLLSLLCCGFLSSCLPLHLYQPAQHAEHQFAFYCFQEVRRGDDVQQAFVAIPPVTSLS